MPRARKRASSPVQVEDEDSPGEIEQGHTQPLVFDEALTWQPGKAIPVTELLRRLKALSEELESIPQEDADRATLVPKAQELAKPQLISHKDKGVKAYTLLCVVEMFRLLAPDAPYKQGQLKEVFTLFTSTIVPTLANPSDPYNQQHNAILMSLTSVKSIVLLTDIPGSDTLILNLFTNSFDVMSGGGKGGSGEKLPKNLEYHMTNMLCTLIDECSVLPSGVVDIILAQFLRADPHALSSGAKKGDLKSQMVLDHSPAYNMARSVCNTCSEKMNQEIGKYFNSVLVDVSRAVATSKKASGKKRAHDEIEDESDDGLLTPPAEDDLREVEKAHRLLRELWRSSPDVIRNVVPQIEIELGFESAELRTMAVQTIGDMIAGIGAAGLPATTPLDPAAYPSQSSEDYKTPTQYQNVLLEPKAPHAFSSVYATAYQGFVDRHKDKSPLVRSAWMTEAGHILFTSGGGKGLDEEQETTLLANTAGMLVDTDERVRLAGVQAVSRFDFSTIIQKVGKGGGVDVQGSVLHNLADRIKDRKSHVRSAAMELLGRIWGVAAGAITEGREKVRELLGTLPSKIFEAMYINDREINVLVQRVLFDSLLPIGFPPFKAKQAGNDDPQRVNDSQALPTASLDPDAVRAERILVLVRDLEVKAKPVFFALQGRQGSNAKYLASYLKACEEYNSNIGGDGEKDAKKKLDKLIEVIVGLPQSSVDPMTAPEHLQKFAKYNDRRSYQLIRFCFSPDSDYRKVSKAMKELTKRMEDAPAGTANVLETLLPLVRSAAIIVYNRSHVPQIVEISRTDEKGLGTAAHEVLKEISNRAPDIFKVHVHELCESLKTQRPSEATAGEPVEVDTLKACASFSRRFPAEMPKDRDFYRAMVAYAVNGSPAKAAKHAVTVIVSSADKKDMYIKEIQKACIKNFKYGAESFLSKLAAISQLRLLANRECEDQTDTITDIAISQVLGQVRTVAESGDPDWSSQVDDDLSAKLWALRILVNGLRGHDLIDESEGAATELKTAADQVYKLLNTLIRKEGDLSNSGSTPKHHKARLRLAAGTQLLKLSCDRELDHFLTPIDFNHLARLSQDPIPEVRAGFVKSLKKYLGNGALPNRFYCLVFLFAFEPNKETKASTTTWLKSRAAISAKLKDTHIEAAFARFLSLLAHHQDFSKDPQDLEEFVEYILFYLKNVATQENLPIIYHIAQRVKSVEDGIDPDKSENLYVISDIAEAVIRQFQDLQGWSLQVMSGRVGLPSQLFQKLPSHTVAQEIADRRYIPDELAENLEDVVKHSVNPKKRKSDGSSNQAAKKVKTSSATGAAVKKLPVRQAPKPAKTPKKKRDSSIPSSDRRKSVRSSTAKNYAEDDDSDDDNELEQWQGDEDDDAMESSTPPTSDPTPTTALAEVPKESKKREKAAQKKSTPQKATPLKSTKPLPPRGGRATRAKKEKDIMDVPSDSD